MRWNTTAAIRWVFSSDVATSNRLIPRWLFLRALGAIYFSAFFSLLFQIRGLVGPQGILPATNYLEAVSQAFGHFQRFWFAPTLLWYSSSSSMLLFICWLGAFASLLIVLNIWPRAMLLLSFVCFLSFVSAAQDFAGYQSDGMLLEAGFISLFYAPPGLRPGFGKLHPPSRASLFLLQWEWFRIYFESGAVKLLSGDPQWRNFTAMDEYYQNGPLPTWIGWYVQHLPHWFHAATVYGTLGLELGLVWLLFLPRRWRIVCFFIASAWQIGVILTANYAFLNYLVLSLGILLLDDDFSSSLVPRRWSSRMSRLITPEPTLSTSEPECSFRPWGVFRLVAASCMLAWVGYATTAQLIWMFDNKVALPTSPVKALEPFRIANSYGLFAVMTRARYEIEFQGSSDGEQWVAFPFRYKPQALDGRPRIYAPYQPRFDWNLWFASLGSWRDYPIVPNTQFRLLTQDKDVLALFEGNPFGREPPRQVRAVLWRYWFTTLSEKRATGMWWRRHFLGLYAPTLERTEEGQIKVVDWPRGRTE
jgi:hypothetical protein